METKRDNLTVGTHALHKRGVPFLFPPSHAHFFFFALWNLFLLCLLSAGHASYIKYKELPLSSLLNVFTTKVLTAYSKIAQL